MPVVPAGSVLRFLPTLHHPYGAFNAAIVLLQPLRPLQLAYSGDFALLHRSFKQGEVSARRRPLGVGLGRRAGASSVASVSVAIVYGLRG